LEASGESEALLTEVPLKETSGRILLADDNADMRRYLQRLLETHYQVRTVGDGEAALNSARADPPDLILSDIMMPRMDGLQLIQQLRIFGVDPDASRQSYESFLSRILPEDRDFVRRTMDAAIQRTAQFDIEYRIVRPDGSIRHIHASGQPITDHFIEFLSTVMDITDRKRADEEQRKLALVVENSPNFVGFASLEGQLQLVNPAGQKLLGLASSEEVLTTTLADCVAEQARQDFRGRVLASVWREGQWEGETLLKNFKTRALIPTLQHIFLVRDPASGRPVAMATICRDITERKKAEDELRRSEAYLATAERLSHIGSWAWNVSTGELFWSEEHFRILGLDPSKRMPKIDEGLRFIHPEDLPAVEQAFARIMQEGGNFEVDCRIVRPDGTIRYVHSRADAVFNGSGKLVEYAGTIIDNTERKQEEEALQRAKAELAHMARLTTMANLPRPLPTK
jgi:PAS domain S-box-containing protein